MRVMIAGGGTAGHVNPAIAVAQALAGHEVTFMGTTSGAEGRLVPAAGFTLETVKVAGFDRSKPLSIFATGWRALGAVRAARGILKRRTPDVVFGVGGYVSLPACLAARSMRIPVVLHEQNIVMGLANKMCRRMAAAIAVSFEETLAEAGKYGVFTGNPVSRAIAGADLGAERDKAYEAFELDPQRKTLLVFGGSQGAQRINQATRELAELWRARTDVQILHIEGTAREAAPDPVGGSSELIYRRVAFVDRMVGPYAVADLALCRGGASTVAELGVTGVPALIVPYPFHRDRQQERHGRVLEKAGAAVVMTDDEVTGASVAQVAESLLNDRDRLQAMSEAALKLGMPDAATLVATVIREAAA